MFVDLIRAEKEQKLFIHNYNIGNKKSNFHILFRTSVKEKILRKM